MAITPQREEQVLFSRPYYISGAQLFVREDDADNLRTIADLRGKTIGATVGTTYAEYLAQEFPDIELRTYEAEPDIFEDMRSERLAGFVTDALVGSYTIQQAGEDFVRVGPLLYSERCAIPVTKDNAALRDEINEAL